MRYSTEPRFRKYIEGYDFLLFAREFGDKYSKKLMDTAAKTGIDAANYFKHKMQFRCVKMEFQKIVNLLYTTFDDKDLPKFVTKKWIEVYDQSEKSCNVNKGTGIKKPMLRSDLYDFSDAYIVVKGVITVREPDNAKRNKCCI